MDLTPLTPTGKSDWNTLQLMKQHDCPKKGETRNGDIKSSVFLLLSFELHDDEPFIRSCQDLLDIV